MSKRLFEFFNKDQFLSQHWQKKPCFIPGAFRDWPNFLSADELAGLSLEDEIESRLIEHNPSRNAWSITHGPFEDKDFSKLAESSWTLLVQSVDTWVPELHRLIEQFDFIPRWRFDDVMVSFASDNGGVGPHFDNYDVFLVQGEGTRRWRVGEKGDICKQQEIIGGLSHLADFDPIIDVIMQPGDMLYVPPETAHWGQSIGDSIGYSVGYRTIQTQQLLALVTEHLSQSSRPSDFFKDVYRNNSDHKNKLDDQLTSWAQEELRLLADNPAFLTDIIGKQLSLSKLGHSSTSNCKTIQTLNNESVIQIKSDVGINWCNKGELIRLNVEGESFEFDKDLLTAVEKLALYHPVPAKLFKKSTKVVDFPEGLANLIGRGYVNTVNQ